MGSSRYTPTENGFAVTGSSELFNRTLYGSHKNDDKTARFFTFAGDAPQFMGALTDWKKNLASFYAKRGTLISGLALTPGQRVGFYYSRDMDISSRWFHNSEDVAAEFRNGWMDYELTQISPWFPDVRVRIRAYPLLPDDGFLIRYRIRTDQRVLFAAGFGGLTDYIGRFEYKDEEKRYFHDTDCAGNTIELEKNYAKICGADGSSVLIASSFPSEIRKGSAKALASRYPSTFLGSEPENADDAVVRISAAIEPGQELDGFLIVLNDSDEETLNKYLAIPDIDSYLQARIAEKYSCIDLSTPDRLLDLTVSPTVIALDASFHQNSFHHGAFGYHSPFLGWRNWYAPTILGWPDRVKAAMTAHLNQMVESADGEERVWYDGGQPREGHGPSPYHSIRNTTGFLPFLLGETTPYYNMQECALDMMLYYVEWSGDLAFAEEYFDRFCKILDWEERILDPDHDGLYQNFLNTWISDGHSYNGAGCAQASAYNYRANTVMAKIAERTGRDAAVFRARAEKIRQAVQNRLWLADKGILAESEDTVGNRLIHPSPELSTVYLAIDCGLVDGFQAYSMLKDIETRVKSVETPMRNGRLSYSSDWLPKKYSTCGIFPSENACLALAYFQNGLEKEGNRIVKGLVDCYFTGRNPGMAAHVQSARGTADLADLDFTDVSSTYLRLMAEGVFGIRVLTLDHKIVFAPNFPDEWDHADLTLRDLSLHYQKHGQSETYEIGCAIDGTKVLKVPMKSDRVSAVLLNGKETAYRIVPGVGHCFLWIETDEKAPLRIRVLHGTAELPRVTYADTTFAGNTLAFEVSDGQITEILDPSGALRDTEIVGQKLYAKAADAVGRHTVFLRVRKAEADLYLPADFEIAEKETEEQPLTGLCHFPLDISGSMNCRMTEIHNQKFLSPRPEGYSIGVFPNGRYAWEWTHKGHNKVFIDDTLLRNAKGVVTTPSGIPFATPPEGENLACVSIWDNFPTEICFPASGNARQAAVLFVSTTNCMQTAVENARITVQYADGTESAVSLVYPVNIDDWLVPAVQTRNEVFCLNDYNHATVQKIRLDETKELRSIKVTAVANEVILGVIGITLSK